MLSPGSCIRCNCALAADSDGELCPVCRSADDTSRPPLGTPELSVSQPDQATLSHHPCDESPDPNAATDSFGPLVERVMQSAGAIAPLRTLAAPPPSMTVTGPDLAGLARLPSAPPGYELIRKLGGGGMGDVFLAQEYVAEREVAMKFLRCPGSSSGVERFLAEVRALARVDHPHIIKFLATDFYRDQPFFTMEYAAGGNLADRVSLDGPLEPREAARLIATASRAVQAAHTVHVLHRDLKPRNILVTADGNLKVSDFGLAKLTDRDDTTTRDEPLGTPGYMPPEQIGRNRGPVGPASDVYGLGATLYHLLTGRAPFVGDSQLDIVDRVANDLPDRPRSLRPEIPRSLEAIALKCLEKEPSARYASAADLAYDLDEFVAGRDPRHAVPLTGLQRARRWLTRNRKAIGLAVLTVALAAGLVAVGRQFRNGPPPDPEQVIRDEIASGKEVRLLDAQGRPRVAIWPLSPAELTCSPDGSGTCTFESEDSNVVLLLRDPGVDSYRLRAKVEQTVKAGHKLALINALDNEVGLVVGYAGQFSPNGRAGYALMALSFREYEPGGRKEQRKLTLTAVGGTTAAGFELAKYWKNRLINTGQKFDPPGKDSRAFGTWRYWSLPTEFASPATMGNRNWRPRPGSRRFGRRRSRSLPRRGWSGRPLPSGRRECRSASGRQARKCRCVM